jgi:hypothetical protein
VGPTDAPIVGQGVNGVGLRVRRAAVDVARVTLEDPVAAYRPLSFVPGGYEPLGAGRGRERSTWMTPVGSFEVEQEFAQRPADGRTLSSYSAERVLFYVLTPPAWFI